MAQLSNEKIQALFDSVFAQRPQAPTPTPTPQELQAIAIQEAQMNDADTRRAGNKKFRLKGGEGSSFDAYETSTFRGEDGLAEQRAALDKLNRWDAGTATDEDVIAQGNKSLQLAAEMAKGGTINPENKKDKYNRELGTLTDAQGNNIADLLNTPEHNAGYDSFYNQKARAKREVEAAKAKALEDEKAGRVTDAEADTFLGSVENNLKAFASGTAAAFGKIVNMPNRIIQEALMGDITDADVAMYKSIKDKLDNNIRLSPEELAFTQAEKTVTYDEQGNSRTFSPYENLSKIDNQYGAFEKNVEAVEESVADTINRTTQQEQSADLTGRFTQAKKEWEKGDQIKAIGTGLKGLAETLVKHPEASLTTAIESLPEIGTQIASLGISATANMVDRMDQGIEEFQKENGRRPNQAEMNTIIAVSTVAAAIDAGANEYIGGALRASKAVKPSEVIKNLKTSDKKVISAAAKLAGTTPVRMVGAIAGGMAGETVSEGVTDLLQQYAAKQDLSDLSYQDAYVSAGIGAGAGGVTKGTIEAPQMVVDTVKDTVNAVTKGATKATKAVANAGVVVGEGINKATEAMGLGDIEDTVVDVDTETSTNTVPGTPEKAAVPKPNGKPEDNLIVLASEEYAEKSGLTPAERSNEINLEVDKLHTALSDLLSKENLTKSDVSEIEKYQKNITKYSEIAKGLAETVVTETSVEAAEGIKSSDVAEASRNMGAAVVLGSKDGEALKNLAALMENPDTAPEIKETAVAVNDFVTKRKAFLEKNEEQVAEEILGDGINEKGQRGLGAYVKAINAAVATGKHDTATGLLTKMKKFRDQLQDKYKPVMEAVEVARKTGEDQTVTLGNKPYTVYGKGPHVAENFVQRRINDEVDVVSAGINAMEKIVAANKSFKPEPATPVKSPAQVEASSLKPKHSVTTTKNEDGTTTRVEVREDGYEVTTELDAEGNVLSSTTVSPVLKSRNAPKKEGEQQTTTPEPTTKQTNPVTKGKVDVGPNRSAVSKLLNSHNWPQKVKDRAVKVLGSDKVTDENVGKLREYMDKKVADGSAKPKNVKATTQAPVTPAKNPKRDTLAKQLNDYNWKPSTVEFVTNALKKDLSDTQLDKLITKLDDQISSGKVEAKGSKPAANKLSAAINGTTETTTTAETEVVVEDTPAEVETVVVESPEAKEIFSNTYHSNELVSTSNVAVRKEDDAKAIRNRIGTNKTVFVARSLKKVSEFFKNISVINTLGDHTRRRVRRIANRIDQLTPPLGKLWLTDVEKQPLLRLTNKTTGKLPKELVAAMSLVGEKAILGDLQDTLLKADRDDINHFFGRPEGSVPTRNQTTALSDIGTQRSVLAKRLGDEILKVANLGIHKDADGLLENKLSTSLGDMLIAALALDGQIQLTEIPQAELQKLFNETGKDAVNNAAVTRKLNAESIGTQFVKVTNKPFDKNARKQAKTVIEQIEELTGTERSYRGPHAEPVPVPKQTLMKRTRSKVSKHLRKALVAANNKQWRVKTANAQMLKMLDRDTVLDFMGYEREIDELHVSERIGARGKNENIERQYDLLMDFLEEREDSNEPFYFDHEILSQGRMQMKSRTVNPTASKLHRFMIGMPDWESTIRMDNKDNSMNMLIFGLAHSFGYKMNNETLQKFKNEIFDPMTNTWANTEKGQRIHRAIELVNNNNGSFTPEEQGELLEALSNYNNEGVSSLDGIIAFANMVKAIENGDKTFDVDLFIEVDGTSNGVITTALQFPNANIEEAKRFLNGGGLFFEGDMYTNSPDHLADPLNYDNYERNTLLADKFIPESPKAGAIKHFMGELIIRKEDTPGDISLSTPAVVTSSGRKAGKVLLVFNYGSGPKAIQEGIADQLVESIYSNITALSRKYKEANSAEEARKVKKEYAAAIKELGNLLDDPKFTIPLSEAKEFLFTPKQEKMIKEISNSTYGEPIYMGMTSLLGTTPNNTAIVNNAMKVIGVIFQESYNRALEEIRERSGGKHPSKERMEALEDYYINLGIFPGFKHATSESNEDGISLITYEDVAVGKTEGGVVKTEYATKVPLTIRNVSNGQASDAAHPDGGRKGMTRTVTVKRASADTSVKGAIYGPISMDANVNAQMQISHNVQNVYDANGSGVGKIHGQTVDTNRIYVDMNQWSHINAVRDRFNIALKHLQEMPAEQRRVTEALIVKALRPVHSTRFDADTDRIYSEEVKIQTVGEFVKAFRYEADVIEGNRKKLLESWTHNDQYMFPGASYDVRNDSVASPTEPVTEKEVDEEISEIEEVSNTPVEEVPTSVSTPIDTATETSALPKAAVLKLAKGTKGIGKAKIAAIEEFLNDNEITSLNDLVAVKGIGKGLVGMLKVSAETDTFFKEATNENLLGSSSAFNFTDLVGKEGQPVNAGNLEAIFNGMENEGNKKDSPEHVENLRSLLKDVLAPIVSKSSGITLISDTRGDETMGAVDLKNHNIYLVKAESGTNILPRMSAQEVFTHELSHILWQAGLAKNTRMYRKLANMARKTQKALGKNGYEIFLNRDAEGNLVFLKDETAEREAAKEMYEHVFNSPDYVQEFATTVLTNEALRNAASKVKVKDELGPEASVVEKVVDALVSMVQWFEGYISRTGVNGNVSDEVRAMAKAATLSTTKFQKAAIAFRKGTGYLNTKASRAISNYIFNPYMDAIKKLHKSDLQNKAGVVRFAIRAVSLPAYAMNPEFRKRVNLTMQRYGFTRDNMLFKLMVEMRGPNAASKVWHEMLRMTKYLEGERFKLATNTQNLIKNSFHTAINEDDERVLHDVVLKGEMGLLVEKYSTEQLVEILKDDAKLNAERLTLIDEIRKEYGANATYYIRQAKSLGHLTARGRAGEDMQMMNGYNIVNMKSLPSNKVKPVGDLVKAEEMVERLASLYTLTYTAKGAKTRVGNIIEAEFAVDGEHNGFTNTIAFHNYLKEESLKNLFDGDKTLTAFGYTKENMDPNVSFKIGTEEDKDIMKAKGYGYVGPLELTKGDIEVGGRVIYVSNLGLDKRRVSGVSDLQNLSAKGTDIREAIKDDKDPNLTSTRAKTLNRVRKIQMDGVMKAFQSDSLEMDFDSNRAVPVMGTNGVTTFRYMMTTHAKDKLLKMDNKLSDVMGQMHGSIMGKRTRRVMDKGIVKQLKKDFDEGYAKDPSSFVVISKNSTNPKHVDLWNMLTDEMKYGAKQAFDGNKLYVREEMVDFIFGFKKASMTDSIQNWLTNGDESTAGATIFNTMRVISLLWEGVVARAKNNTVIFTPAVVIGNFVSNLIVSTVAYGMNPVETVKGQLEALNEIRSYQRTEEKRNKLRLQIQSGTFTGSRKNVQTELDKLNADLVNSAIHPLIQEGVFNTIVEDVDEDYDRLTETATSLFPFVSNTVDKVTNSAPESVKTLWDVMWLKRNTKLGKEVYNATAHSDFIARYAAYKHLTQVRGMGHKEAIDSVMDTFVSYDEVTSPELQYANDKGFLMYTKFLVRIQRVIFKQFRDKPANAIGMELLQQMTSDISDILDSNLGAAATPDRFSSVFEVIDSAFQVPAFAVMNDFIG